MTRRSRGRFKTPIELSIDLPPGEKDACPLIIGRHIKGIKNGESPAWLKKTARIDRLASDFRRGRYHKFRFL